LDNNFTKERTGTGTYEWADINANACLGCPHGGLYCYARMDAMRFNRISNREEWLIEKLNPKALERKWPNSGKVIMFPTTHDITPTNLEHCIKVLKNMLIPGNKVLIVSKPHLSCIKRLREELEPWKEQILFRFTIGSLNSEACAFWEPYAPSPQERLLALMDTYNTGFQTSVSMEPMLFGWAEAIRVFKAVEPFVTETVWIGKMNKIRNRIDMSLPDNQFMVGRIEHLQRDEAIMRLVSELENEPKVRWKDSIKKVIGD